jgi:hypothetical protein
MQNTTVDITSAPHAPNETEPSAVPGDHDLVHQAEAVLSVHIPDDRGMCAGCLNGLDRLVWYPCEPVKWSAVAAAPSQAHASP